jgi:DNA-binding transcriptional LysR family regulator
MTPLLLEVLVKHPLVTARSFFTDQIVHLLDDGFDVALRIAHLPDSGLTALRVGHVRRVVVASPAYLAAQGVPRTPADVTGHAAIGFSQLGAVSSAWTFHPPVEGEGAEVANPRM